MNNELIEAFKIRFGWGDEAILSIPSDKAINEFSDEEFEIYLNKLKEIKARKKAIPVDYYSVTDGIINCASEEEWDEE